MKTRIKGQLVGSSNVGRNYVIQKQAQIKRANKINKK